MTLTEIRDMTCWGSHEVFSEVEEEKKIEEKRDRNMYVDVLPCDIVYLC